MLHQDEEIAIFKDIKPVAEHHYLAIPKVHIKNVKHLTLENKLLGMLSSGNVILMKQHIHV